MSENNTQQGRVVQGVKWAEGRDGVFRPEGAKDTARVYRRSRGNRPEVWTWEIQLEDRTAFGTVWAKVVPEFQKEDEKKRVKAQALDEATKVLEVMRGLR